MGMSKLWKPFLGSSRVTSVDERKALQSSAEFLSVVAQTHHGASDRPISAASDATAGAHLRSRCPKFLQWISKKATGYMQQKNSVGKNADAARKQAWTDSGPRPESSSNDSVPDTTRKAIDGHSMAVLERQDRLVVLPDSLADDSVPDTTEKAIDGHSMAAPKQEDRSVVLPESSPDGAVPNTTEAAIDGQSVAVPMQENPSVVPESRRSVRLDTPADDAIMARPSVAMQRMTQEQPRGQARRPLAAPLQQDPNEELERQWAGRMLASVDHGWQQQPRLVIDLPRQQQDPIEELERQWAESVFASMSHGHQQQLRVAIGLPKLPSTA